MSEWISIKTKMPEGYHFVLVCELTEGSDEPIPVGIGRYEDDSNTWHLIGEEDANAAACGDLFWSIGEITHWQYLPSTKDLK